jgi:hypothetical protein
MTLPVVLAGLLTFGLTTTTAMFMYYFGLSIGRKRERHRCENLCRQSWENHKKMSPTVRRVYCSIANGDTELVSDSAFFG